MATDCENWTNYAYESDGGKRFVDSDNDNENSSLRMLLRELLEELNLEGREMLKKLISRAENDVTVKSLLRKTLRDVRGSLVQICLDKFLSRLNNRGAKSSTVTERSSVGGDVSSAELKLERFKVKTVNIKGSGIVKEEEE